MAIVAFIIVLALLILAHEVGHFVVAKLSGVRIHEFGLGFPPRLLSVRRGDTRYSFNLIPLGGFVRMKEYPEEGERNGDSFQEKKFLPRLGIIVAGAAMNVILAGIIIIVGYMAGFPQAVSSDLPHAQVTNRQMHVASVLPDGPALKAGLEPGDELLSANGLPILSTDSFISFLQSQEGESVLLERLRGEEVAVVEVFPTQIAELESYGIGAGLIQTATVKYPPHWAVVRGIEATGDLLREYTLAFAGIISSLVRLEGAGVEVSGPVGIAMLTGQAVRLGLGYVLYFAAILSVNLAIINLIPFPALDGGRAILLIIEKLRRKALGEHTEALIHNAGFVILIFLVLAVTIKDLLGIEALAKLF